MPEDEDDWDALLSGSGHVSPQQISDFDHMRREAREELTLWKQPLRTITTCLRGLVFLVVQGTHYVLSHKIFLFVMVPIAVLWLAAVWFPGPHTETIEAVHFNVEYVVWWVGLGILSSIGLGSGLQSGVLFLFPHILKTCLVAQSCKTVDFDSASDMWFRSPPNLFQCPDEVTADNTPVTFWAMWSKIILVCFLQSAGTAIGEIPPYWMTRAAHLAALEAGSSRSEEMPEELEANSKFSIVNRGKEMLVWILQKHGFLGVLLMASYPNIAFDLCGICCGHFLMPFWTFFIATFLGKAIIRNSYQSIIYVMLCSEEHLETLIKGLQYLLPDSLELDHWVRELLEDSRESFHSKLRHHHSGDSEPLPPSPKTEAFVFWWQLFTGSLLVLFFLSSITHFAQYYQLVVDREDSNVLRRRLPHKTRMEIQSPNSGKLMLPTPTLLVKARVVTPPSDSSEADSGEAAGRSPRRDSSQQKIIFSPASVSEHKKVA